MTGALTSFVENELSTPVPAIVRDIANRLAETPGAAAILFYGSNLRTGAIDGVLDFYVLTGGLPKRGMWPMVGYREFAIGGRIVRAKIATMRLATFARAAAALTLDTTIWTRFVQPCALVWSNGEQSRGAVIASIAAACVSAARFAAALGPDNGTAHDYWRALFRQTYAAELRVEKNGREDQIIGHRPERYDALLPLALAAGGIVFGVEGGVLRSDLDTTTRQRLVRAWRVRRAAGKPINIARLVRAAFTFEGAARYGIWKIERHTGVSVPLTAWRERHPILAAPGVLWRVWRARTVTA